MFNEFYYINHCIEPLYFSIISLNGSVETSLYVGKKMVKRKSFDKGLHVLKIDNIELKLHIKTFKVIPEVKIDNQVVEFQKLSRKELRGKLQSMNIINELNPKQKPLQGITIRELAVPLILILSGILWQVFTQGKGKAWDIPAMIFFFIAYYQISSPLLDIVPERYLDEDTKGRFKLLAGMGGMIMSLVIISNFIQ